MQKSSFHLGREILTPYSDPALEAHYEDLIRRAVEQGFVRGIVVDDYFGFRTIDRSGAVPSSGAGGPVLGAARVIRRSRRGEL